MKFWASFVILAVVAATALAQVIPPTPAYRILTEPEDQVVRIGADVIFNCEVENIETFMDVTWNNGSSLMTLGRKKYVQDERVSLDGTGDEYTLLIRDVNLDDEGSYLCGIAGTSASVEFALTVNIPPEVEVDPEGETDVLEGDPITLHCEADGKPTPIVTWSRLNNVLPSGDETYEGEILTLTNLSRHDSGEYECTAVNDEDIDRESVIVNVRYAPTLTAVEEETIYTGPRDSVTILCEFSASPEVNVLWKHNGSDIIMQERTNLLMRQESDEDGQDVRMLEISNLQPQDLGTYSCRGANRFGDASATFVLTAKPKSLLIVSDADAAYSNEFTLLWEMSSVSPPIDYTLVVSMVNESGTYEFGTNSVPAQSAAEGSSHHKESYTIEGLQPNQTYKVEVQGRNAFDVSDWAIISFTTADAGKTPPPPTPTEPESEKETPTEPELTPEEGDRGGSGLVLKPSNSHGHVTTAGSIETDKIEGSVATASVEHSANSSVEMHTTSRYSTSDVVEPETTWHSATTRLEETETTEESVKVVETERPDGPSGSASSLAASIIIMTTVLLSHILN